MGFFIYSRTDKRTVKDPNDENKVIEKEVVLTDVFDINRVIRAVSRDEDTMVILLDDGYESSEDALDQEKSKPGKMVIKRERTWKQSQIVLTGIDIKRFIETIKSSNHNAIIGNIESKYGISEDLGRI